MESNVSVDSVALDYESIDTSLKLLLVSIDYVNLVLLLCGTTGMYQGIEIQHPLYAVLFMNLIVSWISSLLNTITFPFLMTLVHAKITNIGCLFVIFFHGICWLLTAIIRNLYIVHETWLYGKFPNIKVQFCLSVASAVLFTVTLCVPCFGYLLYAGKFPFQKEIKRIDSSNRKMQLCHEKA